MKQKPNKSVTFWVTELEQCETTAKLLEEEARTWADGWAVRDEKGNLTWTKEHEWAKVRCFRLVRAAEWMRAIVKRRKEEAQ